MAIETLYPAIRPSLDLNFAGSKTLDPRINFNRASAATYYDGKTVAKAEENLLRYSQMFNAWNKVATSVIENSVAAPDGTMTGATVTADGAPAIHNVYQEVVAQPANTMSVYAKAGTESILQVYRSGDADVWANFDLATGSVGSTGPSVAAATMIAIGNGWYRCSIYTNSTACGSVYLSIVKLPTSNRGESNTSTGTLYFWGAQLEQRSQVTAYTPTTSQPITNYIPVLQTAPAGVPRFDHNPVTGESLGLLVEEQRTNLLAYSEQFDNGVWSKGGCTISANSGVSPDGTLTADLLVETTATGDHYVLESQAISWASGSQVTGSVFVKPKGRRYVRLLIGGSSSGWNSYCVFDLLTGSIGSPTSNSASITARSIIDLGNGWYRCSLSASPTVTSTAGAVFQVNAMQSGDVNATSYTGDGYSGIYVWGAQLEAGAFPTSYIKTEASQATRAADSASMTGANFSSWYRQDEGTLFSDAATYAFDSSRVIFELNNGSTSNRLYISRIGSTYDGAFIATVNGVNTAHVGVSNAYAAGVSAKTAAAYKVDNFAVSLKGVTPATDSSGFVPVVDRMSIGSVTSEAFWSGTIKKLSYYPKRLSDAQLQSLTT